MQVFQLNFKLFIAIICLLVISESSLYSQTKKEVQFSLDTLVKKHQALQEDFKAQKAAWKLQNNFFEHVKSIYFDKADINTAIEDGPAKFDEIYKASISELETLNTNNKVLSDSLEMLKAEIEQLDSENTSYNKILLKALSQGSFPQNAAEFTGTWDLFLHPVQLNGEPLKAGIIAHNPFIANDSIMSHGIYKIEFAEDEIASLYFKDGTDQKSFYSISNFSDKSSYTITFTKSEEFKLTMHVSPMPYGLVVSYEVPVKSESLYYFYGLMKK